MSRNQNTDRNGRPFSEEIKKAVWNKAQIIIGYDPNKIRKDSSGAWIYWDKYGDTEENGNGWEIDHIKPVAKGGRDELANLQPLQWENNRKKADNFPTFSFIVSAK